jgi:hypothetical protein
MNGSAKQPFRQTIYRLVLIAGFIGLALPATMRAQQTSAILHDVQSMNLPVSKGKITIYYAEGYQNRVSDVRPLLEEMMAFYQKKLGIKENFSVAILTKEQWLKHVEKIPYGLPYVRENVAFLPATSDGVVTAGAIAMKAKASPATLKEIKDSGYDFEAGAMKFTDVIGLHELGHVYTFAYGIKSKSRWLNEFLASYFAYAFLMNKHPKVAALFQAMATDVYADGVQPKYTSLDEFERLYSGVGVDNYAWYEGKFLQKGAQIYAARKLEFLSDVKKAFPSSEAKAASEPTLERMEKVSPGITDWSKSLK